MVTSVIAPAVRSTRVPAPRRATSAQRRARSSPPPSAPRSSCPPAPTSGATTAPTRNWMTPSSADAVPATVGVVGERERRRVGEHEGQARDDDEHRREHGADAQPAGEHHDEQCRGADGDLQSARSAAAGAGPKRPTSRALTWLRRSGPDRWPRTARCRPAARRRTRPGARTTSRRCRRTARRTRGRRPARARGTSGRAGGRAWSPASGRGPGGCGAPAAASRAGRRRRRARSGPRAPPGRRRCRATT